MDLDELQKLPLETGVYLIKDLHGEVIYIGKAKNLRQRVKQYFSLADGRAMVPYLVEKAATVETIVVSSEKEALLVENNLIKEHQPRYNALLKDDKSYVALKINHRHAWPMLSLVRYTGLPPKDALYFGPYTSAAAAKATLEFLQKKYPLRQCSDQELARRQRPCILYDMKRCTAPCVGLISKDNYHELVDSAVRFLKGDDRIIIKTLYQLMGEASDLLEFERAADLLETIRALEKTIQKQHVDNLFGSDVDSLAIYREGDEVLLSQMLYRKGKLVGVHHYPFSNILEEDSELFVHFIMNHYPSMKVLPKEIYLPISLHEKEELSEVLSQLTAGRVNIVSPQRGNKQRLVDLALKNAQVAFRQKKDEDRILQETLVEMQEILALKNYPEKIECIDTSNLGGDEMVSSVVCFRDGKPDKSGYRKYKVKQAKAGDDYGALREVLSRRCQRGKEEENLPDLFIIDGGKGHFNIAQEVLHQQNLVTCDLIAIVKEQGRHDRGQTAEKVFIAEKKEAIALPKHSALLFLLQKIRDEAHRFAITFQRVRRNKKSLSTRLEDIEGIGPVKRKALLKYFGSVKAIQEATVEELMKVKGITASLAAQLLADRGEGGKS